MLLSHVVECSKLFIGHISSMHAITYRTIKFEEKIIQYNDLKTFQPFLPCASYLFPLKKFFE